MIKKQIKFIDLFAGIGGFNVAFTNVGAKCVFVSEWDKEARKTYKLNYEKKEPWIFINNNFAGDITKVDPRSIPDFDILTGGFPCQPFSHAGFKKGFEDTRGTLFYNVAKIIEIKKPAAFFLENVSHLLKHNNGETFATIKKVIEKELGYSFYSKIVRGSDFNIPQHRPRLYMIGFRNKKIDFDFPKSVPLTNTLSKLLGGRVTKFGTQEEKKIGYTLRVGGRGSGIKDRRNWDSYVVNGKVHTLTVEESIRMMGFPKSLTFPVTKAQAMKQLGNAVVVPAIQAVASVMVSKIQAYD